MKSQRDTVFVEDAEILEHVHCDGDQHILRLRAPKVAGHALPGSFIHLCCDPQRPLRRPISIMRVDANSGEIRLLYKVLGEGTRLLSRRKTGEILNLMGPIGNPFELHPERSRPLLIGGGVGMPPMIFLADMARREKNSYAPFVILGSEVPFPFPLKPSGILIPGLPDGVIASMPLLEDWHIPARLTSTQGYPGCHEGYVTDLARLWLDNLDDEQRNKIEIFSCGPHPMLEAVAQMARDYDLPAQVSLEEFMACGVGGCAGCVVEVQTANGPVMKRVCVDGPVFDARQVFA